MKTSSEHHGFRVPEGYFSRFPERLYSRLQQTERPNLPVKDGLTVPEGYFNTFADRVEARLKKPAPQVYPLRRARWIWASAAAAAVLLLILFRAVPDRAAPTPRFEDLAGETLEAYLNSADFELTSHDLNETLFLEGIGLSDMLESGPTEDLILDYIENDTDTDDELYWENQK